MVASNPNLRQMHDRLVNQALKHPDYVTSADVQIHDVLASSYSCVYPFDLKQGWLTHNRWNALVRQYIDPEAYYAWLDMITARLQPRKRGVSFMRTNSVQSGGSGRRLWGSCLLGFGYKSMPTPTLTLHSRTTYLGFIGQLDLALAHVIARDIGERVGLVPDDIQFRWYIEAAQFHRFRSLAWWFQSEKREDILRHGDQPWKGLTMARKEIEKMDEQNAQGLLYGDESYSSHAQKRKRYNTEIHGYEFAQQFSGGTRLSSGTTAYKPLESLSADSLRMPVTRRKIEDGEEGAGLVWDEADVLDFD